MPKPSHPGQLYLFEQPQVDALAPLNGAAQENPIEAAAETPKDTPQWAASIHDYYISTLALSATCGDSNKIKTFKPQSQLSGSSVQKLYTPDQANSIISAQSERKEKNKYVREEAAWRLVDGDGLLAYNESLPEDQKILPLGSEIEFIHALGSNLLAAFDKKYGGTGNQFQAERARLTGKRVAQGITVDDAIRELWASPRVQTRRKQQAQAKKRAS